MINSSIYRNDIKLIKGDFQSKISFSINPKETKNIFNNNYLNSLNNFNNTNGNLKKSYNSNTLNLNNITNIKKQYVKHNNYVITIDSVNEFDVKSVSEKLQSLAAMSNCRCVTQSIYELHFEYTAASSSSEAISEIVKAFDGYNILSCYLEIPTMDEIFIKLAK